MTLKKISKSFFINLDRRADRLDHIYKTLPFYAEKFSAVDAKELELNKEIKLLFPETYNKLTKAEIACALSHYRLWKQLSQDKDADNYLILEDDVVFESGFVNLWNLKINDFLPNDFMLVYLGGCQPWNKPHYQEVLEIKNQHFNTVKENDHFTKGNHYWHMNASSYIVSRRAATLLCQWVEQKGFNSAWDVFMINFFNENKLFKCPHMVYHLNPLMARQIHEANENIEADKNSDIRFNEDRFDKIKNQNNIPETIPNIDQHTFSNINNRINHIPKILHVSWKNKDILSSQSPLILNGLKNFEKINPDWKIEISNDEEVDNYIKKNVSLKHYNLIKDKKIVQKTDLWRLLKICNEGGLYIDIDRYVNIPMSEIIKQETKCVLPMCGRIDFSQDFVCGIANYYIHKNAINKYLQSLEAGKGIFECGAISYMHSVSESLCGYKVQRKPNSKFWNDAIYKINHSAEIESFIEGNSFNKILFKHDPNTFIYLDGKNEDLETEFKNQKAEFYNNQSVQHWNVNDRKYNEGYKQKSKKIKLIWQVNPNDNKETYESDWLRELLSDIDYEEVVDGKYSVLSDDSIIVYTDIWHHSKIDQRQDALYGYLKKAAAHKNVSIVHLGDEYTQARTEHYKDFKLAIRTTYNHSVRNVENLIQIPLGYKQGFHD
jgi:GR25 family glycosyltransferase involved in LPS biosynthesis